MEAKPSYLEHRQRLRERFHKNGAEGMHDYEVLELLLTYAIPRKDVKPIAKDLLRRFDTFAGVLDANPKEIEAVAKVGSISSTLIRLVKEIGAFYLAQKMKVGDVLSSPQAVLDFARAKLAGHSREAFMVIFLNTKNRVLHHLVIQEGTVDRAVIYPRRLVEEALNFHASGVILVHNHPSGDVQPSNEDKQLTRAIIEAVRPIDLKVLDHIIVGKEGHFSFRENHFIIN